MKSHLETQGEGLGGADGRMGSGARGLPPSKTLGRFVAAPGTLLYPGCDGAPFPLTHRIQRKVNLALQGGPYGCPSDQWPSRKAQIDWKQSLWLRTWTWTLLWENRPGSLECLPKPSRLIGSQPTMPPASLLAAAFVSSSIHLPLLSPTWNQTPRRSLSNYPGPVAYNRDAETGLGRLRFSAGPASG